MVDVDIVVVDIDIAALEDIDIGWTHIAGSESHIEFHYFLLHL